MTFLENLCSCVPLRGMCLAMGYTMLAQPLFNLLWVAHFNAHICNDILTLGICADFINLSSCVLLLCGIYRDNSSILPLHIVSKLIALIVEMICHLILASVEMSHPITMARSFFSIGTTFFDVLIVLSYYQQVDQD
ncbi:uncharacterized protein ms(2)35Ci [Drosophila pseudoobscura]|uniref:Uncharacterized protein ms(2)35Ci n=1 Tax=Drosophila pseudoobscura pseudoobscura TaxID=46245 RepID=Q29KU2_DROPS|nr:uncharacterized protein LOC4816596 [Drosophila pseudoobscura]